MLSPELFYSTVLAPLVRQLLTPVAFDDLDVTMFRGHRRHDVLGQPLAQPYIDDDRSMDPSSSKCWWVGLDLGNGDVLRRPFISIADGKHPDIVADGITDFLSQVEEFASESTVGWGANFSLGEVSIRTHVAIDDAEQ